MNSWCLIDEMVSLCVVAALCMLVLNMGAEQASAAFEGIERIEYDEPFGGWVTALPDGRLMTFWTEDKPVTTDETGSVQLGFARFSLDKGATWTEPQLLFEFPRVERPARYEGSKTIIVDRAGGIHIFGLLFGSWSWEKFEGHSMPFHVMSDDNGHTWSQVQTISTGYNYGGMHQPVVLSSGRIVVPMWHAFDDKHDWGSICCLSDDRGKTWRTTGQMGPTLKDEQSGVELSDGRIYMLFRKYEGGRLIETYSSDGGETWRDIRESRFIAPASPPALMKLADGRILLIWNNSLKPKHVVFNRLVLAAAISPDDGKTWYGYREIARTSGIPGPDGLVVYPWITQTNDGTVIVTYQTQSWQVSLIHLDPDWLEETSFYDDFSEGLDNWITLKTKGVEMVDHPATVGEKVMALRKPDPDTAAGASLNFPFGAQGQLTTRVYLRPGFHGVRLTLTDHFTWPYYAEDGAFSLNIAPDGTLGIGQGEGKYEATEISLDKSKWCTLTLQWDAEQGDCQLLLDDEPVAQLPELSDVLGVCYLRLWSEAEHTDKAGMLLDSIEVSVTP